MAVPTIELFSTSILSNIKVRTRHERYTSVLAIKKIPYVYHDLASDEDAKSRWRRKAKDPQLPGILVNNEWVGSYDDFEEAVEFGEVELFLGTSSVAPQVASPAPHPAQSAVTSKDPSLYPTLPYAPEGAGRWNEPDADQFISSLNITEDEINDADVDALLADIGKLPSELASTTANKYVPSKEAAIKPLRLAKMGLSTSHERMPSGSPSSSASAGSRASPMARYSAAQRSTRAMAAEAAALTSNRKTSGALLRDAVSQGKTLDEAMEKSSMRLIVSQDNIDDLFASLGLSNVDIEDDEVDQFLEEGAIPQGLRLGGERVHKPSSMADKARDETVARDLAFRAKEKGHGSARTSLTSDNSKLARLQPASQVRSSAEDGLADTLIVSGRTSVLSAQASSAAEASSPGPESRDQDAVKAEPGKVTQLKENAEQHGDALEERPVGGTTVEMPNDTADKPVSSASEVNRTDGPGAQETTSTTGTAEPNAAKHDEKADEITRSALPSVTSQAAVAAGAADAIASKQIVDAEKEPETVQIVPPASGEESSHTSNGVNSHASKSPVDISGADADTSDRSPNDQSASTHKAKDTQPSAVVAEPGSSPTSALSTKADKSEIGSKGEQPSEDASLSEVDRNKHTTSMKEVAGSSTPDHDARAAKEVTEEEPDDLELELAQAAMIASRYENRNSGMPSLLKNSSSANGDETGLASSVVQPDVLEAMSRAKSPSTTITSPADSHIRNFVEKSIIESPVGLGVGAPAQPSPSRQVSSSSVSSSRRAIDVSRPIDPATLLPALPKSSSPDSATSPDIKKKRGIFGLGKDRDKEKDKEKEATGSKTSPSRMAESGRSASVPSRHERTISQILREADAVLGLDDYAIDSDNDDTEDSAMFGASSIDVEAGPTSAVRSSSRS